MDAGNQLDPIDRVTAPMQEYRIRQVAVGLLIALIAIGFAYAVPFALAA